MIVLALDLGTSSVRSALFDERARRIDGTTAQRALALKTDADGAAELDPLTFARAIEACVATTLASRPARRCAVDAVGVSCFWHSLIGVDADGDAVTPIVTWADTRPTAAAAELRVELDERIVHARTGCMLRPSFWPAKLRWLAAERARVVKRVACWLGPADWLLARWCGAAVASTAMASATGLYAQAARAWDRPMLAACGLDATRLPPISDGPLGATPASARRFPALARARFYAAIGDGAAANLGSGATRAGVGALTVGTSAAARLVREVDGAPPFGLFGYRIDVRRGLVGGAVSNAGNVRAWCLRELRLDDGPALERALAARPGPCALDAAPYLYGERAPDWRDGVHAALGGITGATTALDLLHALTDSAWQRLAAIVERLPGADAARFVVGGGIQRSPASLQRLADVLARPLHACDEAETSLRGAAVYALEQDGRSVPPPATRVVRPRRRWADAYREQRERLTAFEKRIFAP